MALATGVIDILLTPGGFYVDLVPATKSMSVSMLTSQEERENSYYDLMVELHKEANIRYGGRYWT